MDLKGTYCRWTRIRAEGPPVDFPETLVADILGSDTIIHATPETGKIMAKVPNRPMNPDEARMIGVRLIEAVLADNGRSVREP